MAYCTQNDIELLIDEERLADLTVSTNANLLNDLIDYVSLLMDGVLGNLYSVPIYNCQTLIDICVNLVICRLYERRGISGNGNASPEYDKYCKTANELLTSISKGDTDLIDNDGNLILPESNSILLEIDTDGQIFTNDIIDNFVS